MRKAHNLAPVAAFVLSSALASGAVAESTFADQLEMLEWSDPERAAQIVDAAPPLSADSGTSEIEMLEIRGMIFADATRDTDVEAVVQRLDSIAGAAPSASSAAAI